MVFTTIFCKKKNTKNHLTIISFHRYCLSEQTHDKAQEKIVVSSMHWHAHSVTALAFNVLGDHLYSGGREGVLVAWQLRSGARSFLPRLGAALLSVAVSPDARWIAAACASNQVALVDAAEGRVARFVVGLRLAAPADAEYVGFFCRMISVATVNVSKKTTPFLQCRRQQSA